MTRENERHAQESKTEKDAGGRPPSEGWHIGIVYCEPTYDHHHERATREFTAGYKFLATEVDDAVGRAMRDFRRTEQESNVNWVRKIIKIEATPLSDDDIARLRDTEEEEG